MSKNLKIFLIVIGAFSILYSVYGLFTGADLVSASTGIIIGAGLIGSLYIEDKKKNK
jgi:hypothetical protein